MKKTISINIGGNIFHIEEEGYDKLKSYLDSVHTYFVSFEDSKEIIDDIENRIAEKFYSQLKKNKEAITSQEVDNLIASMGTVADFEATFDDELLDQKQEAKEEAESDEPLNEETEKAKKLYRDSERGILGGVAAGTAHYFGIDALWIRLLWILLLFSGFGIIVYIIFWVVLPEKELEEKKSIKRFYRDSDNRVFGGVASGIASFFGVSAIAIRLVFIVSMFIGGSGVILYLILWIITPLAKSVTQKMQMKGEPVTMAGIEKNVKKNLKIEEGGESVFTKILLFPFRLIAMVFEGLGRVLEPFLTFFLEAIRIVFGAAILLAGFVSMISLIFVLLFALGFNLHWGQPYFDGIPVTEFLFPLAPWTTISAFVLAFIPALAVALGGLAVLLKRGVGNIYVTIAMVVIWFVALMGAFVTFPSIVGQFSSDDSFETETLYQVTEETPVLKLNDIGYEEFDYEGIDLRLRGHEGDNYLLVLKKEAWGSSRNNARKNAQMIDYSVKEKDGNFDFDSRATFMEDAKFRFQKVDATFYIPYGKEFTMEQELDEILTNTLHLNGYKGYQMRGNTWMFDEYGIQCVTCSYREDRRSDRRSDKRSDRRWESRNSRSFGFENFDEIRVSSAFKVYVYQSEKYEVKMSGLSGDLDQVMIQQSGDRLTISHENEDAWGNNSDDIKISIYMPELSYFRASGKTRGGIESFNNDAMELDLSGEANFELDVIVRDLDIELSGKAKLEVFGDADTFQTDLSGGAYLISKNFDARDAVISASGRSTAKVFADDDITISASGDSKVYYRGTSNATITESGSARVRKD